MAPFPNKAIPKVPNQYKTKFRIITGTAYDCEEQLNKYGSVGKLHKIVSMCVDHKLTTILLELYS